MLSKIVVFICIFGSIAAAPMLTYKKNSEENFELDLVILIELPFCNKPLLLLFAGSRKLYSYSSTRSRGQLRATAKGIEFTWVEASTAEASPQRWRSARTYYRWVSMVRWQIIIMDWLKSTSFRILFYFGKIEVNVKKKLFFSFFSETWKNSSKEC